MNFLNFFLEVYVSFSFKFNSFVIDDKQDKTIFSFRLSSQSTLKNEFMVFWYFEIWNSSFSVF